MADDDETKDALDEMKRFTEVEKMIQARGAAVKARFQEVRRLMEEARKTKEEGHLDAATALLRDSDEQRKRVDAQKEEVLQMLNFAREAHERADGDPKSLRAEIRNAAAQGILGFASVDEDLVEGDSWWGQRP